MLIVSHMLINVYCIPLHILMSENIGLSEDQSYELFGHLVDDGLVDPGRAYRVGGAMPGSTSRIVGREENMTLKGDDVRLTGKGRAEIQ